MADITIWRGDGITLQVTITSPADASTADYAFALWQDATLPDALLRTADLVIVDNDPDPDTVTVVVPGSTTADLAAGTYKYELKYQPSGGEPETITHGVVVIHTSAIGDEVVAP